ncbi:partial NAD(P) transhydrogenase subunit alpha part 1, partial [Myxococcaceae bacterium]
MIVAVPREIVPGEKRVALVPDAVKPLIAKGIEVAVESGAGEPAGLPDDAYRAAGARIED